MLVFRPPLIVTRNKRNLERMSRALLSVPPVTRVLLMVAVLRRVPSPLFHSENYLVQALALDRQGVHSIPG